MVPFPEISAVLLEPDGARLADTREAVYALIWEICERLNVIAPAARSLAARAQTPKGRLAVLVLGAGVEPDLADNLTEVLIARVAKTGAFEIAGVAMGLTALVGADGA